MRCCSWCPFLAGQDKPPHKQDGPWSWVVLLCAFLQSGFVIGLSRSYGVFLPVLMKEFNEGREQIALIGSLSVGGGFFFSIVVAWLNTLIGGRLVCSIGHVITTVAYTLSSVVHQEYAMFFTFSPLIAVGMSCIIVTNTLIIIQYFKKHRSLAIGLNMAGGAVGLMTIPNLIQYLLDTIGWRNTFRVCAGCVVLLSLLSINYSPNVEKETHGASEDTADTQGRQRRKAMSLRSMFDLSVWRVPKYVLSVISISIATFGFYNPSFHLVKFSEEIGISATKASILYTFIGISSLISRVVTGKLCDLSCINPSMVNMAAEILAALVSFFLTLSSTYVHLVVLSLIYGFADGMFRTTTIILLTTSVTPSKAATAFGQAYSITAPFYIAGPAIAGLLADVSSSYTIAFYVGGSILIGASAVHLIPTFIGLNKTSRNFALEEITLDVVVDQGRSDGENNHEQKVKEDETSHANPGYTVSE